MSAYVVGNYSIHDFEKYREYIGSVQKTIAAFGGKTILVDHDHQVVEGKPSQLVVVVEFSSREDAHAWYGSEQYQKIIHFRKESTEGWVTVCSGFNMQEV